jgi:hypothetical protein
MRPNPIARIATCHADASNDKMQAGANPSKIRMNLVKLAK